MSNQSKRKRTDFTGSQIWERTQKQTDAFHKALAAIWNERIFESLTQGSKSSYTEPTGSEDM
jgi:hypothetical protein